MASRFVQLTRLVERRAKWTDRSDLHAMAYAPGYPVWVRASQVAAVTSMNAPVETGENEQEMALVTLVHLAGVEHPVPVAEDTTAVLAALR